MGLDGTMLDHIKAVNTPNLDRLMAEGTTGSSSILGHPTISAPSWSTILTGVWNAEHGVQDNSFAGARYDQYPSAFTQIERTDPGRPDFIFTQVDQVDGAGHWTGTLGPAYN
ncbi:MULTISPECIES: alkaline phosphatase family protein [Rhodococcus]|uniref:alkaline phosphatase family protein n=1 Tax=Rhodococcus TaxID=1827 RepID=UPI00211CBDE8|nr:MULTISPECIES: alkaline phosphatase family protein [Rhodococcus]MCZ4558402.1 alkaline phosphatase family protein [Rhodococcus maanshanensis]